MKKNIRILLGAGFVIFALALLTRAQIDACDEPTAYKFSEFDFRGEEVLKTRISEFEAKLRESPIAQGIVFAFGGRHSRIDEITKLISMAEGLFTISKSGYDSRVWIRDGGYRNEASFVFLIKPKACTAYSVPLSDLAPDQVDFEGFSAETTVRHAHNDLLRWVPKRPATPCPPAAAAVRACVAGTPAEVFILVDSGGRVVFARAIGAHPLIRAAAEAYLKSWEFKVPSMPAHSSNRSGIVNIVFNEGAKLSSN